MLPLSSAWKLKEIFSSRMFVPTKPTRLHSVITSRLQHGHSHENVKSNMCVCEILLVCKLLWTWWLYQTLMLLQPAKLIKAKLLTSGNVAQKWTVQLSCNISACPQTYRVKYFKQSRHNKIFPWFIVAWYKLPVDNYGKYSSREKLHT
jgi:hypothetical protein